MPSKRVYKQYIIGRNFIKSTSYENINTGRRKKSAQNQPQIGRCAVYRYFGNPAKAVMSTARMRG